MAYHCVEMVIFAKCFDAVLQHFARQAALIGYKTRLF